MPKNKGNVSSSIQDEAFMQSRVFWIKDNHLALTLPKSLYAPSSCLARWGQSPRIFVIFKTNASLVRQRQSLVLVREERYQT